MSQLVKHMFDAPTVNTAILNFRDLLQQKGTCIFLKFSKLFDILRDN